MRLPWGTGCGFVFLLALLPVRANDDFLVVIGEFRSWGKSSTLEAVCRVPYFVWSNQLPAGVVEGPISTGTVFPLLGRTPVDAVVYTGSGGPDEWRATQGDQVLHHRYGKD